MHSLPGQRKRSSSTKGTQWIVSDPFLVRTAPGAFTATFGEARRAPARPAGPAGPRCLELRSIPDHDRGSSIEPDRGPGVRRHVRGTDSEDVERHQLGNPWVSSNEAPFCDLHEPGHRGTKQLGLGGFVRWRWSLPLNQVRQAVIIIYYHI